MFCRFNFINSIAYYFNKSYLIKPKDKNETLFVQKLSFLEKKS